MESIRVLFTGGPGGGKSSALATLRDHLSKRGFQALVVPETATALFNNSGGYDPAWVGTHRHVELQQIFMRFQMQQEDTYRAIAKLRPSKPHVILLDRGLLEGRLFCSDDEWAESLQGVGTTEEELLKRYDLVIHMTTIAAGMEHLYDYGPGSSNPSRYHTPEAARETDLNAQMIYAHHPQVRVVPNFADFSEKIDTVIRCVTEALHMDGLAMPRERFVLPAQVEVASGAEPLRAWPVPREEYEVQVTFLDKSFTESIRQRQLVWAHSEESVTNGGAAVVASPSGTSGAGTTSRDVERVALFEYRREIQQGTQTICTRRVLNAEAYHLMMQRKSDVAVELRKRSVCFCWEGNHYELCTYFDASGGPLPESWDLHGFHVLDKPKGSPVPPWLEVSSEAGASIAHGAVSEVSTTTGSEGCADSASPHTRKLRRHATADAALSVEKAKRQRLVESFVPRDSRTPPRKRTASSVMAAGELLSRSPNLSKAVALVMCSAVNLGTVSP